MEKEERFDADSKSLFPFSAPPALARVPLGLRPGPALGPVSSHGICAAERRAGDGARRQRERRHCVDGPSPARRRLCCRRPNRCRRRRNCRRLRPFDLLRGHGHALFRPRRPPRRDAGRPGLRGLRRAGAGRLGAAPAPGLGPLQAAAAARMQRPAGARLPPPLAARLRRRAAVPGQGRAAGRQERAEPDGDLQQRVAPCARRGRSRERQKRLERRKNRRRALQKFWRLQESAAEPAADAPGVLVCLLFGAVDDKGRQREETAAAASSCGRPRGEGLGGVPGLGAGRCSTPSGGRPSPSTLPGAASYRALPNFSSASASAPRREGDSGARLPRGEADGGSSFVCRRRFDLSPSSSSSAAVGVSYLSSPPSSASSCGTGRSAGTFWCRC